MAGYNCYSDCANAQDYCMDECRDMEDHMLDEFRQQSFDLLGTTQVDNMRRMNKDINRLDRCTSRCNKYFNQCQSGCLYE